MGDNSSYRGCRTSALQEAQRCPFACQKTYRDKIQGGTNDPAITGTALHDLLEDYGNHCLTNKFDTDYEYFDSIYRKYMVRVPPAMYNDALRIARKLKEATNFDSGVRAKAAFVERRIFIDIHGNLVDRNDPDLFFASGIDYYYIKNTEDGMKAYVEDYKSYRLIPSKVSSDSNLQRKFYPLLVFLAHPEVEEIEFRFNYIRYNYPGLPYHYTREDIPELLADLHANAEYFYELMEMEGYAECRPSGFCPLCPIQGHCPAIKADLPESYIIKTDEDASELVRAMLGHRIALKKMSSVLKSYVENNGNVKMSDKESYGVTVLDGEDVDDMLGLVNFLIQEKKVKKGEIFDSIKFKSKKGMEKIFSNNSVMPGDVARYLSPKKKTRVEYKDNVDFGVEDDGEDEEYVE